MFSIDGYTARVHMSYKQHCRGRSVRAAQQSYLHGRITSYKCVNDTTTVLVSTLTQSCGTAVSVSYIGARYHSRRRYHDSQTLRHAQPVFLVSTYNSSTWNSLDQMCS